MTGSEQVSGLRAAARTATRTAAAASADHRADRHRNRERAGDSAGGGNAGCGRSAACTRASAHPGPDPVPPEPPASPPAAAERAAPQPAAGEPPPPPTTEAPAPPPEPEERPRPGPAAAWLPRDFPWPLAAAGAVGVALTLIGLAMAGVFSSRENGAPPLEPRLARMEQQMREFAARPLGRGSTRLIGRSREPANAARNTGCDAAPRGSRCCACKPDRDSRRRDQGVGRKGRRAGAPQRRDRLGCRRCPEGF